MAGKCPGEKLSRRRAGPGKGRVVRDAHESDQSGSGLGLEVRNLSLKSGSKRDSWEWTDEAVLDPDWRLGSGSGNGHL